MGVIEAAEQRFHEARNGNVHMQAGACGVVQKAVERSLAAPDFLTRKVPSPGIFYGVS